MTINILVLQSCTSLCLVPGVINAMGTFHLSAPMPVLVRSHGCTCCSDSLATTLPDQMNCAILQAHTSGFSHPI